MIAVADDPTPPYPRMWKCRSRFDSTLSGRCRGMGGGRCGRRGRKRDDVSEGEMRGCVGAVTIM